MSRRTWWSCEPGSWHHPKSPWLRPEGRVNGSLASWLKAETQKNIAMVSSPCNRNQLTEWNEGCLSTAYAPNGLCKSGSSINLVRHVGDCLNYFFNSSVRFISLCLHFICTVYERVQWHEFCASSPVLVSAWRKEVGFDIQDCRHTAHQPGSTPHGKLNIKSTSV